MGGGRKGKGRIMKQRMRGGGVRRMGRETSETEEGKGRGKGGN